MQSRLKIIFWGLQQAHRAYNSDMEAKATKRQQRPRKADATRQSLRDQIEGITVALGEVMAVVMKMDKANYDAPIKIDGGAQLADIEDRLISCAARADEAFKKFSANLRRTKALTDSLNEFERRKRISASNRRKSLP
jgi:hypothetical protein